MGWGQYCELPACRDGAGRRIACLPRRRRQADCGEGAMMVTEILDRMERTLDEMGQALDAIDEELARLFEPSPN